MSDVPKQLQHDGIVDELEEKGTWTKDTLLAEAEELPLARRSMMICHSTNNEPVWSEQ